MPGPQFFTPKSVKPSRPKRRFTLAEANKTLPLVQRVVRDIVQSHAEATQAKSELENLSSVAAGGKEHLAAQNRLESAMRRIEDFVDELTEIGCELKDYQSGLIDFIGRHDGHDVCLCWKMGEGEIAFWHECDAGFAGRQPVSSLHERKMPGVTSES